jgi:hypothetical protein
VASEVPHHAELETGSGACQAQIALPIPSLTH